MSLADIAATVERACRPRRSKHAFLTHEERRTIFALRVLGLGPRLIAELLSTSPTTVLNHTRRAYLAPKPTREELEAASRLMVNRAVDRLVA